MRVLLKDYGIEPTRAHSTDAGLDLYAPYDFKIGSQATAKSIPAFACFCRIIPSDISAASRVLCCAAAS